MSLKTGLILTLIAGFCTFIYFAVDAILYGLKIVAIFAGGVGLLAAAFVAVVYWRRESNRFYRAVDGSFPLQKIKLTGGAVTFIDPNKMIGPAGIWHPQHGWMEIDPTAGWDHQRAIAALVQQTRSLAALAPDGS